jgi:glycerol-3-phosphate acyltransferase PlsY
MLLLLLKFLFLVLTYFISAIPFGLVLAKIFAKQDIRQHGSGNIGATNVARVLGKKLGIVTLFLDGIKGALMVIFARFLFEDSGLSVFLMIVGGVAVIGHVFPVYLKFKGGKGVATTLAVLLAVNPILGLFACTSWLIIFLFTKISAVASLCSIIMTTGFTLYSGSFIQEVLLCAFLTIIIFIRHKENISRILAGTEKTFRKNGK